MSVNKYRPHVFVLPEDDANRQLANGFLLELESTRQMLVEKPAGGWLEVLNVFETEHIVQMENCHDRNVVLLIDFDDANVEERLQTVKNRIPDRLADRVFVLGSRNEPEDLKELGSLEAVGKGMARDCRNETRTVWDHPFLRHNVVELERLRQQVRPILF
jgi:hypothetical protein